MRKTSTDFNNLHEKNGMVVMMVVIVLVIVMMISILTILNIMMLYAIWLPTWEMDRILHKYKYIKYKHM